VKEAVNIGGIIHKGHIAALPDFDSIQRRQGSVTSITLQVLVRLKNGWAHPMMLLAFWDPDGQEFVPYQIGVPTAEKTRAFLLF